jgi:hypothetical protein
MAHYLELLKSAAAPLMPCHEDCVGVEVCSAVDGGERRATQADKLDLSAAKERNYLPPPPEFCPDPEPFCGLALVNPS